MAKRYGMVLNIDRCIGCYACVVACKMAYGTRPGIDYNGVEPVEWGEYPNAKQRFKLTMCMHCDNAPCIEVCPVEATYQTKDGVVLIDYDKCIGCGACVTACPYDQRKLVTEDITSFEGELAPFEEESSKRLNIVEKCIYCYGRLDNGEQPMCVEHCPGQSRIFGDINDPNSEISKYIKEHDAIQVKGTSMYYVIPEGMDRNLLPQDLDIAMASINKEDLKVNEKTQEEEKSGVNVRAVAGVVGVAAVAGGAYAISKNKLKDNDNISKGGDR